MVLSVAVPALVAGFITGFITFTAILLEEMVDKIRLSPMFQVMQFRLFAAVIIGAAPIMVVASTASQHENTEGTATGMFFLGFFLAAAPVFLLVRRHHRKHNSGSPLF
jgi:hypothetical protein